MTVKLNLSRLSEHYLAVLRSHLAEGSRARLQPALLLGRAAVGLKLETLELARIHEQALIGLGLPATKNGTLKCAEKFFNEVNSCIEETHRAAQQSTVHLNRLTETLGQRKRCLEESLQLQNRLRQLTHRVIATQEAERTNISRELQDEIAQTLLGINVRLLSLKQAAHYKTNGFRNEIASTRRLVAASAQSVRRVARKIRNA